VIYGPKDDGHTSSSAREAARAQASAGRAVRTVALERVSRLPDWSHKEVY
jgi:hypothetical protein